LSTSLDNFLSKANKIKEKLEDDLEKCERPETFMEDGQMESLKKVVPLYRQIYLDMKVYQRKDLDQILQSAQDEKSKESVQEFYKFEESINEFLGRVDSKKAQKEDSGASKALQVGDIFPSDLELKEVTTEKTYKTDSSLFCKSVDGEFIKHCIVVLMRKYS